ncbi:hypothetical protein CH289_11025 [Rhodococcus sp. RS1C4]|uniref:GAF domain-containing protein n=1 Tax=Nocardiaceae TaxID=85025 RepID=UPI0003826D90|nr:MULTISPECIES: GAF domain-containing protein [Rhodococcus]OZC52816.1 hypothetical protein CH289_11025 [Rhodococcus sp. RS1C4]OZC81672.1 hypothetical protein CH282_17235 [Rhodococcus sp. 06-418-1B]OZD14778.1 hypothetical protein CH280_10800 [Rhodococcus sp. 06-156-4C]OZD20146.1 hypothetical protein CH248_16035 [Rhodococcus sp. 06-156-4a]OZD22550.1 hypothetical protein CH253_09170 [Rhodococcus sp. 06-156-3C]
MKSKPDAAAPQRNVDAGAQPWMLVETLHQDRATLVSLGGRLREMSSLPRAVRSTVGGRSSAQVWAEVARSIDVVREHATSRDVTIPTGSGRTRVVLHPVVGPSGAVHGIALWVGDAESAVPQRPEDALAVTFESERRAFVVDADCLRALATDLPSDIRTSFTSPEVFRKIDVDDAVGAIGALLQPAPDDGATWTGLASTTHLPGVSRLDLVFTADDDGSTWRGLVHAVESETVAQPRLETAAFAALGQVSPQMALVLMDVTHNRLIRWLTDPVPQIQWKGIVDDRDTPHPDDVTRIFAAASGMYAGTETSTSVDGIRLRRIGGGWTVVDARAALLPREKSSPRLMLVQMTVVGHTDDPDPVPVDDTGHPSLLD